MKLNYFETKTMTDSSLCKLLQLNSQVISSIDRKGRYIAKWMMMEREWMTGGKKRSVCFGSVGWII